MKMEERDRLIRQEGEMEGRAEGFAPVVTMVRKKLDRGMDVPAVAEALELEKDTVNKIAELIRLHTEWTELQIAGELVREER